MGLQQLPFDVLLTIVEFLDLSDVLALRLTSKFLHAFASNRPVILSLAHSLLARCRPLTMTGFYSMSELSTKELMQSVQKATRLERAWQTRSPRPSTSWLGNEANAHYSISTSSHNWYIGACIPPGEEVEWLSPIMLTYILCATKCGKIMCWDVTNDLCLSEWNFGQGWRLHKVRVVIEERTAYVIMGKMISSKEKDCESVLEFSLIKVRIPEPRQLQGFGDGQSLQDIFPDISHVTNFTIAGAVMHLFLLNPVQRILSAHVWIPETQTIGLYLLPDWMEDSCIFVDTAIICNPNSRWSSIQFKDEVIIHCEESDSATQYFFSLPNLREYGGPIGSRTSVPALSSRVPPSYTRSRGFIFPHISDGDRIPGSPDTHTEPFTNPPGAPLGTVNPFQTPPWSLETACFVRQWWPTVPRVPHLSCTVTLLSFHNEETHENEFVLSQHYFKLPLCGPSPSITEDSGSDMRMWYTSRTFEIAYVPDGPDEFDDTGVLVSTERPLIAVDFGYAVWIEYVTRPDADTLPQRQLSFVSFPSVDADYTGAIGDLMGHVRKLEVPPELNLETVETLGIDQSQGAVILSVAEGMVFILFYE